MATDKANRSATDQLRDQATVLGEDVQELGRIARTAVTEKYEEGLEKAQQMEKSLETQIKHYPLRSVAIAAGVGLVVGILLGRR